MSGEGGNAKFRKRAAYRILEELPPTTGHEILHIETPEPSRSPVGAKRFPSRGRESLVRVEGKLDAGFP
jgi:hypothetical protein